MRFNVPNALTWMRIVMIPLFVGVFYFPSTWLALPEKNLIATVLFTVAALTDLLDGYLARKLNQMSAFGAFLDPVADKLMVAAALIVLVDLNRLNAVIAVIIIGREITISALREWMALLGAAKGVAVSLLGKIKTVSQIVGMPRLLYHDPLGAFRPKEWGTGLVLVAAALTLWSMFYYLKMALPTVLKHG